MDWILWTALAVVGTLIGIVLLGSLFGLFLRKSHVVSGAIDLPGVPRARVFALLADVDGYPSWRPTLKKVERLPDRDGQPVWREHTPQGPMTFRLSICRAPDAWQGTIVDNRTITGGWDIRLDDLAGSDAGASGTRVTVTERGTLHNPFFVFVSKFFDLRATLRVWLGQLAAHLGQPDATVSDVDDPPPLRLSGRLPTGPPEADAPGSP